MRLRCQEPEERQPGLVRARDRGRRGCIGGQLPGSACARPVRLHLGACPLCERATQAVSASCCAGPEVLRGKARECRGAWPAVCGVELCCAPCGGRRSATRHKQAPASISCVALGGLPVGTVPGSCCQRYPVIWVSARGASVSAGGRLRWACARNWWRWACICSCHGYAANTRELSIVMLSWGRWAMRAWWRWRACARSWRRWACTAAAA